MMKSMKQTMNVIWMTMKLQMKQSFARPMFRFCLLINPVVNTIFLYEMFLNSGEDNFMAYVVLGAGLMGLWCCICFSSAGDINRERFSGTLPLIYVAPEGFGTIIFGKICGNTLISLLSFGISYGTAFLLTGKSITIQYPVKFLFAFLTAVICFVIVSLCVAYFLMLSRKTELYMNLLEIPFELLCGFVFPIEILPKWIQYISNLLAPTWAVRILKESIAKNNMEKETVYYLILGVEVLILVAIAVILYRWMDRSIRKKATLEVS